MLTNILEYSYKNFCNGVHKENQESFEHTLLLVKQKMKNWKSDPLDFLTMYFELHSIKSYVLTLQNISKEGTMYTTPIGKLFFRDVLETLSYETHKTNFSKYEFLLKELPNITNVPEFNNKMEFYFKNDGTLYPDIPHETQRLLSKYNIKEVLLILELFYKFPTLIRTPQYRD